MFSAAPLLPTSKKGFAILASPEGDSSLFRTYGPALCLTPLRNKEQHSVEECLCLFFSMCIRILALWYRSWPKGKDDRWSELSADCQAGSVCCSPRISPDLAFAFLSVLYDILCISCNCISV